MLWALALLGLVPAAFAIGDIAALGDKTPEEEDASEETGNAAFDDSQAAEGAGDVLDYASGDEGETDLLSDDTATGETVDDADAAETDAGTGDDYEVVLGSGETLFADFEADVDHVTLNVNDGGAGEFIVEPLVDAEGAEIGTSLSYATDEDETILSFLGHDTLPADDISVSIFDPESGETTLYALNELGDFGAIAPNDDDTPAATGETTGETVEHVLSDTGETLVLADDTMQGGTDATLTLDEGGTAHIDTEGTLNLVTGGAGDDVIATGDDAAIVDGGDGNDVIYGGDGTAYLAGGAGDDLIYAGDDTGSDYVISGDDGADRLYGGDGDDTLIMDGEDTAAGGAGDDTFWLYYDANAGVGHAQITDFSEGEDFLRITLDPNDSYTGTLDVEVSQTVDGASSQVIVNGDVVAVLYGSPHATVDDVLVEISPSALTS
ncbi:calcium-binding protein [Celeribacter neptunius]|uniref:Hemolysin-type calcium-binding repeat-containing protein n=1 Tax=Celeribacter neptunius TaxID=588602 RepID=A0A1I3S1H5_9RHOB|nr:hypothetical protein [Celeribacter neptunius]SFJ51429.1 hypothetical protein SAMN04487991_2259 [Celeribacter neptunius]